MGGAIERTERLHVILQSRISRYTGQSEPGQVVSNAKTVGRSLPNLAIGPSSVYEQTQYREQLELKQI